ncbi:hypothetical protein [Janibacter limosus]|uniref:hypothetical protein n=1 Tax=Janibacter limosus TaxID=53458 RepID=UPI000835E433|nr:hypothetical protein [Janibacter limosus]
MTDEQTRTIDIVTMGCRWVLDVSDLAPDDADAMAQRWQRCVGLVSAPEALRLEDEPISVRVYEGDAPTDVEPGTVLAGAASAERVPYALSREITRAGLMRLRGRATLLHAAALADPAGRALALVAPSGGGKSTATRVLGTRLGYVSDESVILLSDGRIAPHPKPPSLVIDEEDRFHKEEPAPDALGLGPTPSLPRLTALLTLSRDPEVTEPAVEEVGLIEQVLEVIPETSSTWWLDDGLDRLARAVTAGGPPARLRYAEIETCHELVREHLERAAPVDPTWEHLPAKGADRLPVDTLSFSEDPDGVRVDDGELLARAPWSDAIACDGEVLVLAGPRPLRLAGPGAVIWRAAGAPTTLDELSECVVAELGEHPQALDLTRAAVEQLLAHGVLLRA